METPLLSLHLVSMVALATRHHYQEHDNKDHCTLFNQDRPINTQRHRYPSTMSVRVAKATAHSIAVGASNVRYDTKARARDTVSYVTSLSLSLSLPPSLPLSLSTGPLHHSHLDHPMIVRQCFGPGPRQWSVSRGICISSPLLSANARSERYFYSGHCFVYYSASVSRPLLFARIQA